MSSPSFPSATTAASTTATAWQPAAPSVDPLAPHHARALPHDAVTTEDVARWAALEAHALEPNAYASPHFVLPALRHLDPGSATQIVFIEQDAAAGTAAPQPVAVFALRRQRGNKVLPLPHTEVYQSMHSFCGAPLLAQGHGVQAWQRLFAHLRSSSPWSFALVIRNLEQGGEVHRALQRACDAAGYRLHDSAPRQRAMLLPEDTGPQALKRNLRKQHAEVERCKRRVAEGGELSWHIHRDAIEPRVVEDFLRLEHAGWKGEEGSSLRAHPAEEAFFQEMVQGFASEGRALFTELRLAGQTIASTSNLVSGATGFAFKVGWDPAYRKNGIGILNEAELVRNAPQVIADLQAFDSGAEPASFIEKLWPGRRSLVTSIVLFNRPAHWALQAVQWARERAQRRHAAAPQDAPEAQAKAG